MAWTEADRVVLRGWLGYSAVWLDFYTRAENAFTAVQAISDGGSRPDNSTELAIRGFLADLVTIEAQMRTLWAAAMVNTADNEVRIDAARGAAFLRSEGRRVITKICAAVGLTGPAKDVFSSSAPDATSTIYMKGQ